MNILIKLTCLIGLVIAPILGAGNDVHNDTSTDLNKQSIRTGEIPSNASYKIFLKASSFVFDRESKTIESITIKNLICNGDDIVCAGIMKLANEEPIVFKANNKAIASHSNKYSEFDKKVSGTLDFANSVLKATLLFSVKSNGSEMQALLLFSSDDITKLDSEIKIYIKGRQ